MATSLPGAGLGRNPAGYFGAPPGPPSQPGKASGSLQLEEDPVEDVDVDAPVLSLEGPEGALQQESTGASQGGGRALGQARSALASAHDPLPHGDRIQQAFGRHDISDVRTLIGGRGEDAARDLGARAFTVGDRIGFGEQPDLRLAAHEAAHAVQQRQGVDLPGQVGRRGDAYERHADAVARAVTSGSSAESLLDRVPNSGTRSGDRLQLEKPTKKTHVPRIVSFDRDLTSEEFKLLALEQLIGDTSKKVRWNNVKDHYPKSASPVTVMVDISLIKTYRAASNRGKGIGATSGGEVEGAKTRAKEFLGGKMTRSKADLMREIDRRYYQATGIEAGTKIKPGETAQAQFWNQIRDEVLFQNEYVQNLPPQVKKLIKISTDGKKITAKDIDQLFRIAKKIEDMNPGDVADYTSKVSASTIDLDVFEAAIDVHLSAVETRKKDRDERESIQTKLYSHGSLYKQYKNYKALKSVHIPSHDEFGVRDPNADYFRKAKEDAYASLVAALKKANFSSIADFESYISRFLAAFRKEALAITYDILDKYRGKLYQEGERYKSPTELKALYLKLGKFRQHYQEFAANAKISNAHATYDRTPGSIATKGPRPSGDPQAAYAKASAAKGAAQSEVQGLTPKHPLFDESHLPLNRRIVKAEMAQANVSGLGGLIQSHIAARIKDVEEAKGHLAKKPDQVFKLPKLMPTFYSAMSIEKGSIFDEIVKDKIAEIHRDEMIVNAILAILAIALAIVSYGAATPAIAAAAAGGGLLISSYFVYDEYQNYTREKDLADVGFTDDPSMFWLIVACAGAALDLGAAVKAVKALGPAAKALNAGGDIGDFINAVNHLKKAGQIEASILEAAEKAALARKAATAATDDLAKIFKAKGVLKSFADPETFEALVRIAHAKISQGVHSFHQFVLELRKARQIAGVAGDMSPEQMAKAKEAWEQAVRIHKSAQTPLDIMSGAKKIGEFSNGSRLEVISKSTKLHGGNTIALHPDRTTTITGVLKDTNAVATRGVNMPGATVMGHNPGGVNVLRSPKWPEILEKHKAIREAGDELKYWSTVTDEFWKDVNKPWLEDAIKRGDAIRFVSDPAKDIAIYVTRKDGSFVLDGAGKKIKSIFGREVDYLKGKGYTWGADGVAIPPAH